MHKLATLQFIDKLFNNRLGVASTELALDLRNSKEQGI